MRKISNIENEILLQPRLSTVKADDSKLKTDVKALARSINLYDPLKLSVELDIKQSAGRIKSQLKELSAQLSGVDLSIVGSKASSAGVAAVQEVKRELIDISTFTKANPIQAQVIADTTEAEVKVREFIKLQKELAGFELRSAKTLGVFEDGKHTGDAVVQLELINTLTKDNIKLAYEYLSAKEGAEESIKQVSQLELNRFQTQNELVKDTINLYKKLHEQTAQSQRSDLNESDIRLANEAIAETNGLLDINIQKLNEVGASQTQWLDIRKAELGKDGSIAPDPEEVNRISDAEAQLRVFRDTLNDLYDDLGRKTLDAKGFEDIKNQFANIAQEAKNLDLSGVSENVAKSFNDAFKKVDIKIPQIADSIQNIKKQAGDTKIEFKMEMDASEVETAIKTAVSSIDELKDRADLNWEMNFKTDLIKDSTGAVKDLVVEFTALDEASKKLEVVTATVKNGKQELTHTQRDLREEVQKTEDAYDTLYLKIEKFERVNSAALGNPNIASGIANLKQQIKDKTISVEDATQALKRFGLEAESLGINGARWVDSLGSSVGRLARYFTGAGFLGAIMRYGRQIITNIREIDAAQVRLARVTDLSGEAMQRFTQRAFEAGQQLGRTGVEVMNAVTEFRRAGYEIEQSLQLGQAALMMVNIGDGISGVTEASSQLIAVMRGFNFDESQVWDVVDSINEVSNTAPIGFANITEGLRRVSATMDLANTSMEETIALLTGGFGRLRNIESVSTGLVMISQRLRGVNEDGEAIEGLAPRIEQAFREIAGIEIQDGMGGLRSTYDILADMAEVFPTLTDMQRQYLSELAAGNRQVRVLNSILEGWSDVELAINSATNATGSAERENAKYLASIEGRTKQLASSFQDLSHSMISADALKAPLITIKALVDGITTLNRASGGLLSTVAAVGALALVFRQLSTAKWMKNIRTNITGFFKDIGRHKVCFIRNVAASIMITEIIASVSSMYRTRVSLNISRSMQLYNIA